MQSASRAKSAAARIIVGRGSVQRVRRHADVRIGMPPAFELRARAVRRRVDRCSRNSGRRVIGVHPRASEDQPDAGVARGANRRLRGRSFPLSVEVEELGDGGNTGGKHAWRKPRRRSSTRPRGGQLRHDPVKRVAAPPRERQVVGPSAQQDLIRVAMAVDESRHDQPVVRDKTRIGSGRAPARAPRESRPHRTSDAVAHRETHSL